MTSFPANTAPPPVCRKEGEGWILGMFCWVASQKPLWNLEKRPWKIILNWWAELDVFELPWKLLVWCFWAQISWRLCLWTWRKWGQKEKERSLGSFRMQAETQPPPLQRQGNTAFPLRTASPDLHDPFLLVSPVPKKAELNGMGVYNRTASGIPL